MVNLRECTRSISKGLFMVINGLIVLLAYSILGFAVVDMKLLKQYEEGQVSGSFVGDICVIFASLLLIVIANVGLVGAIKENLKILYGYMGLLMVVMMLQLLIGIFVTLQRNGLQFRLAEWMREDFFRNITVENQDQHEKLWDDLQLKYECCGLNGPEDYAAIRQPISVSCCPRAYRARTSFAQKQLYKVCIETTTYYDQGCEDEMLYILRSDAEWLLGASVFILWIEGAGMLLSSWVAHNIKNSVQMYQYTVKY